MADNATDNHDIPLHFIESAKFVDFFLAKLISRQLVMPKNTTDNRDITLQWHFIKPAKCIDFSCFGIPLQRHFIGSAKCVDFCCFGT